MTITEKIAYLKGLIKGLDFDETTKESKVLAALIDAVDEIAIAIADNCSRINSTEEDLEALEDFVYDNDDYADFYDDNCDECFDDDDDEDFDYDLDECEYVCPSCHETVFMDDSVFEDGKTVKCPACGGALSETDCKENKKN